MIIQHKIASCTNPMQLYSGQWICENLNDHRIYRKYLLKSIESWYDRVVISRYEFDFKKTIKSKTDTNNSAAMAIVIADAFADWHFEKPDTFEIINLIAVIVELENKNSCEYKSKRCYQW